MTPSSGPSTEMFQILPFSSSNVPRVSQSLVFSLSDAIPNNSGVSLPKNFVRPHDPLSSSSSPQLIPSSKPKVPKYQLPPTPSIHPMNTRSKQLLGT